MGNWFIYCFLFMLTGCTVIVDQPEPSPSASPSATPEPSPSASPTPEPSVEPSPSSAPAGDLSTNPFPSDRIPFPPLDKNGYSQFSIPPLDPEAVQIYVGKEKDASVPEGANVFFYTSVAPALSKLRSLETTANHKPHQLLLRRGDTWDENLDELKTSGKSAVEPLLIGAYGDLKLPRPKLRTGAESAARATRDRVTSNIAIMDIHFEAHTRFGAPQGADTPGARAIYWLAATESLLVENCIFDHYPMHVVAQQFYDGKLIKNVRLRKNFFMTSFKAPGSNSSPLYFSGIDNLLLEENFVDKGGWHENILTTSSFGSHNIYIQQSANNVITRRNIISRASAHGLQMRGGGDVQGNLFINNPINITWGIANGGGDVQPGGIVGEVYGNVVSGSKLIGGPLGPLEENRHYRRGWGLELSQTKPGGGTSVRENIFTQSHALTEVEDVRHVDFLTRENYAGQAIRIDTASTDVNPLERIGVNDLLIANNIIHQWYQGFRVNDDLNPNTSGSHALNNVTVKGNYFLGTFAEVLTEHPLNPLTPGGMKWEGNSYFGEKLDFKVEGADGKVSTWALLKWKTEGEPTAMNQSPIFKDSKRRAELFLTEMSSTCFGTKYEGPANFLSFREEMLKQDKGNWHRCRTTQVVVDWIREGFNLAALPNKF